MTPRPTAHLHDTKLDALSALVEELCGAPLLVAYEFNHDLARLLKRFPEAPYIGSGVNPKQMQKVVDDWNAGRIPVLPAHPASAGHGLNLQGSGAAHIAWFGPIWDLELYEQFVQRVHRQGTAAKWIINHIFVARGTIDELVLEVLKDKATSQEKLLRNLNDFLHGAEPARGDVSGEMESTTMEVQKLSRQTPTGEPPRAKIVPKNWGKPAAAAGAAEPADAAVQEEGAYVQREAITRVIRQPSPGERDSSADAYVPAAVHARAAFSEGIRRQLDAPKGEADRMVQEVDRAADVLAEVERKQLEHDRIAAGSNEAEAKIAPAQKRKTTKPQEAETGMVGSLGNSVSVSINPPYDHAAAAEGALRVRAAEIAIAAVGAAGFKNHVDHIEWAEQVLAFIKTKE